MMKILIDGNSIFFKVYFAMMRQNLTNSTGFKTGAIYGFLNYLNSLKREYGYKFEDFIITFDNKESKVYRKKIYPEYKEGRIKKDQDLYIQLETLEEILKNEGIKVVTIPYFEADDLIYNFAEFYSRENKKVVIVSRDHDLLQGLVFENVEMVLDSTKGKQIINKDSFNELYGFNIANFLTYKALLGDSSDNVKGLKGIGKKTIVKLLSYLEKENLKISDLIKGEIKANDDKIQKIIDKIIDNKDIFLLNRKVLGPLLMNVDKVIDKNYLKSTQNFKDADNLYDFLEINKRLIRD